MVSVYAPARNSATLAAMSMYQVLGRRTSNNVQKVLWLAEMLGIRVQQQDIGGPYGGTGDAAYLAMNPNGTVPTLVHGDFVLWESNAILRYLAAGATSTLYPTDPQLRARTEQWLDWQIATLSPAFRPLYVALVRDRSPLANIPDLLAAARTMFDRLNRSLGEQPWVAGAQQTIADVAVGPLVHRWFALGLAAAEHEALQRFYTRVLGDAAFYKHVASVPLA